MRTLVAAALLVSLSASQAQTGRDRREWPRTDFSQRTVELSEIESGGPPQASRARRSPENCQRASGGKKLR